MDRHTVSANLQWTGVLFRESQWLLSAWHYKKSSWPGEGFLTFLDKHKDKRFQTWWKKYQKQVVKIVKVTPFRCMAWSQTFHILWYNPIESYQSIISLMQRNRLIIRHVLLSWYIRKFHIDQIKREILTCPESSSNRHLYSKSMFLYMIQLPDVVLN